MLPKEIAKRVPKTHLMSETEWRNLGVQQSQGWVHYMIHQPGVLRAVLGALLGGCCRSDDLCFRVWEHKRMCVVGAQQV